MGALKLVAAIVPSVLAADAWSTSIVPLLVAALSSTLIATALTARSQNAKNRTDRGATLDRRQKEFLDQAEQRLDESRVRMDEMARKIDELVTELGAAKLKLAERGVEREILQREVERLHDEVIALRRQIGLGGRRATDLP